jgi:hypothetical protein
MPECLIELTELPIPVIYSMSVQGFRDIVLCIDIRKPLPLQT